MTTTEGQGGQGRSHDLYTPNIPSPYDSPRGPAHDQLVGTRMPSVLRGLCRFYRENGGGRARLRGARGSKSLKAASRRSWPRNGSISRRRDSTYCNNTFMRRQLSRRDIRTTLLGCFICHVYVWCLGGELPQRVRETRSARRAAHARARCKKKYYTYSEHDTWCDLSPSICLALATFSQVTLGVLLPKQNAQHFDARH